MAGQEENETPEEHWRKLITLEKICDFKDIHQENKFISYFITIVTNEKLQEKLVRVKTIIFKTTIKLITQDSYHQRHKQPTIPRALAKDDKTHPEDTKNTNLGKK